MLADLLGRGNLIRTAHFTVIGGGTAGLLCSLLLAKKTGKRVVCLETGGLVQKADLHPLNEVIQRGTHYRGASEGRFRCLGGTSTRWGGALIPFQEEDLLHADWPICLNELAPYLEDLERLFGLDSGPYTGSSELFQNPRHFVLRRAKWPAFSKRNVFSLLQSDLSTEPELETWYNSHVVEIKLDKERIGVTAKSDSGDEIFVATEKLIIAAGAIETTRLTLLMKECNTGVATSLSRSLGSFFSDHISSEVARIEPSNRSYMNRLFGFQFSHGGSMSNVRFELAPASVARGRLPPSFCHVSIATKRPGGFSVLRNILRSFQRGSWPKLETCMSLFVNGSWIIKAVWWRYVKNILLIPADADFTVHVVVEQRPKRENKVQLSKDRTDLFGVPLAEVDWSLDDIDKSNVLQIAELMRADWESSKLSQIGKWISYDKQSILNGLDAAGGIFHPTGTTRMGNDPASSVVDKDLKLFGVENVQLLSTSVLPSGGGSNPTMMLLLLAMRCVDYHVNSARMTR